MTAKRHTRRSYGGESAEDRLVRRRRQLLDAGLEIIGTKGYRAATVRSICREAKVADRYFYEIFEHMEDLLVAVYEECIERLVASVGQAMEANPDGTPLDDVASAGLDAFFSTMEDDRLSRVIWVEVLGVSERVEQVHQQGVVSFGDLLLDLTYRRGVRPSPVATPSDLLVAQAAVGGISQIATSWRLSSYAAPRADIVSVATRILLALALVLIPADQPEA